jgi:hypothetical protein
MAGVADWSAMVYIHLSFTRRRRRRWRRHMRQFSNCIHVWYWCVVILWKWLRHCGRNRKLAGSIPDGIIRFFYWLNPSGRTIILGSTQPQTEMSTRNILRGVKGGRCVGPTALPPSCADCLDILDPVQACIGIVFIFLSYEICFIVSMVMGSGLDDSVWLPEVAEMFLFSIAFRLA